MLKRVYKVTKWLKYDKILSVINYEYMFIAKA